MIPPVIQKQLLLALYKAFDAWVGPIGFACREGCSICCTRSVTMTTLEGERIMTFLSERDRLSELTTAAFQPTPNRKTLFTTNSYAAAYLSGRPVEGAENWDLRTCPFLTEGSCSIYPVRPFGCRVFASLEICPTNGMAQMPPRATMPPGYIGGAAVLLQCIEHLDYGGRWGSMVDLLVGLHNRNIAEYGEPTTPIPGFLIEPHERHLVDPLLNDLLTRKIQEHSIEHWLQVSRL